MTVGVLRLPLTSVLLTTLFLGTEGFPVMPLVIVAVAVSYILTVRLSPPAPAPPSAPKHVAAVPAQIR
jgi:hypothetical protein